MGEAVLGCRALGLRQSVAAVAGFAASAAMRSHLLTHRPRLLAVSQRRDQTRLLHGRGLLRRRATCPRWRSPEPLAASAVATCESVSAGGDRVPVSRPAAASLTSVIALLEPAPAAERQSAPWTHTRREQTHRAAADLRRASQSRQPTHRCRQPTNRLAVGDASVVEAAPVRAASAADGCMWSAFPAPTSVCIDRRCLGRSATRLAAAIRSSSAGSLRGSCCRMTTLLSR